MELALNKVPMEGYRPVLDTTLYQEETQESIVPDAYPDILSVLSTEGRAQLVRRECGEGKAECAGNVRVRVVYLPDGEEGPRHLELNIPFRTSVPCAELDSGCPMVAAARVSSAETRVLNPRKVLCRVELAVLCQGWKERGELLCAPWEGEEYALQQRCEEVESYLPVAVVEKSFAFTDEVALGAGQSQAEEILSHRVELRCGEAKVIGNKLIFKGEASLQCLYRAQDNTLGQGRWELPFSQIVDVGSVEEEGSCTMEVVERESQVELSGDPEGRTLSVHLELLAQAVIRQTRQVRLFADAYSITHDLTVERESYEFTQLWEENSLTETFREVLDTPAAAGRVEDCFVSLGAPQVVREEQEGTLTVQGSATVVYTTEDGVLCGMTRPITVSARVALPPQSGCQVKCALAGEAQAVATAAGVELRCPVRFAYLTTLRRQRQGVCALSAQEREEDVEQPSVRLRLVQPGEGLWDIAKACSTTQEDILRANELAEGQELEQQMEGRLLLIPRSR